MIEYYSFGKIQINGITYTSDIKILKQNVLANWWRKSGHRVMIEDIDDLLQSQPEIVILGKGKPGLMQATPELKKHLESLNIELIEESTSSAVKTFNQLLKQKKLVSAGFHLTC